MSRVRIPSGPPKTDYAPAYANLNQRINLLDELYNAIIAQQERLGLGLKREIENGALSASMTACMKTYLDLLNTTVNMEILLGLRVKKTTSDGNDYLRKLIDGALAKTDEPE